MATKRSPQQRDLRVRSFNMHGLNQGESLLKHWCMTDNFDVLLLQEHWLSPANIHRINDITGTDFTCYSCSSMSKDCSSDLLRGRPYGGLSIIVNNTSVRSTAEIVCSSDRIIAIILAGMLIVDVYFPCTSRTDYKDTTLELLGNLDNLFCRHEFDYVILGGDFNCNIDLPSWSSSTILDFMKSHNHVNCQCSWPDNSKITYHHDSLQLFSCIDYLMVSDCLLEHVSVAYI